MKRLVPVLLFAVISVAICTAQATIRNFHQAGMGSQDIDSEKLEIMHPSLPLGTTVQVTNSQNNKKVNATVIGRISASPDRIVDLSKGVAKILELPVQGSAPVILEIVNERKVAVVPPPPEPEPVIVQVPAKEPEPVIAQVPAKEPEPASITNTDTRTRTSTDIDARTSTDTRTQTNTDTDSKANTDNSTDTRTQTTAPVSAQSPNINIYNINMSPNAMATDSAPVNADGFGNNAQPSANSGISGIPAEIIAAAPSSSVSSLKQTPVPLPEVKSVPSAPVITVPVQVFPQPAPLVQQQPQQQVQQLQQPSSAPVQQIVDVGIALINPYMPDPNNGKIYRVQVGSFMETWHAKEAFDHLTTVGFKPAYERYGDRIRVIIPGIRAPDMPAVARLIGKVGFKEALVREEN